MTMENAPARWSRATLAVAVTKAIAVASNGRGPVVAEADIKMLQLAEAPAVGMLELELVVALPTARVRTFLDFDLDPADAAACSVEHAADKIARAVMRVWTDPHQINRLVADVWEEVQSIFSTPEFVCLGMRLIDVAPAPIFIGSHAWQDKVTVTATMREHRLDRDPTHHFDVTSAYEAGLELLERLPADRARSGRAELLEAEGADGVVDDVTLELLRSVGVTLRDAFRAAESARAIDVAVTPASQLTYLRIGLDEGELYSLAEWGMIVHWDQDHIVLPCQQLPATVELSLVGSVASDLIACEQLKVATIAGFEQHSGNTWIHTELAYRFFDAATGRIWGQVPARWFGELAIPVF